ncbi:MAG: phosphomannomutase/phosphoglucomutase [Planctomycetota bacterium]|nr:phosphomannomutase/phosphoglucomutase [Planctomycetota bacterium]
MAGVFHAYDVRGLCPPDITEDLAYKLGNALAQTLPKQGAVGIARDMRPSSPGLSEALSKGIRDAGRDVVNIGMVTTPCFYYAIGSLNLAGGIIVTASHNPAEYNGFKICREEAIPIGGNSGLKNLEKMVLASQTHSADKPGTESDKDIRAAYIDHVIKCVPDPVGELAIAVDCANGVAGPMVEQLFERFDKVSLDKLYFEPDGTFPNHEANPLKLETLVDLQKLVRDKSLQLGIAFDGDGDRAAFVDEKGDPVASDLLTAFLASDVLKQHGGGTIVYDLRSSLVVKETIEKLGGKGIEERVGHAFIKKTMRDNDVIFGGELSGHYYWKDNYFADSAFMAITRVLSIVSRDGKPLSELIAPFRRTAQSGEINYKVEDKDGRIEALSKAFEDGEQSRLDGISIRCDGWWFNVRKSNTEPVLRLNLEAQDEALLKEKLVAVEAVIKAS